MLYTGTRGEGERERERGTNNGQFVFEHEAREGSSQVEESHLGVRTRLIAIAQAPNRHSRAKFQIAESYSPPNAKHNPWKKRRREVELRRDSTGRGAVAG